MVAAYEARIKVEEAQAAFSPELLGAIGTQPWTTLMTCTMKALVIRAREVTRPPGAQENYHLWHESQTPILFKVQQAPCPPDATQTGQGTLPLLPTALGYGAEQLDPAPNAIVSGPGGICPDLLFLWVQRSDSVDVWAVSPAARAVKVPDTQRGSYPRVHGKRWTIAELLGTCNK